MLRMLYSEKKKSPQSDIKNVVQHLTCLEPSATPFLYLFELQPRHTMFQKLFLSDMHGMNIIYAKNKAIVTYGLWHLYLS